MAGLHTLRQLADARAACEWLAHRGVRGLATDSRRVQPGDAFIAWPGYALDGRQYVKAALAAGASACLVEAEGVAGFDFGADAPVAALAGLKACTGEIADEFYGRPSESLAVVATTGTNGKTSTAWWTAQALSALGRRCGVVGTLGGVALGTLVAYNVDVIVPWIEHLLGIQFLPQQIYFISELPSNPQLGDIAVIGGTSLVLSLLATLYPSWRASRLQPARVLRHD